MSSVLIAANTSWYVLNFRDTLIRLLVERGHTVRVASPPDDYTGRLLELGVAEHLPLPTLPRRVAPLRELAMLRALRGAIHGRRSDVCLTYTPRINCYAPLAARPWRGLRLVRNISGLGAAYVGAGGPERRVSDALYRAGRRCHWTFYQNRSDLQRGLAHGFSEPIRSSLLPGSGVDLVRHGVRERTRPERLEVLMAARLIPQKGYLDFLEAVAAVRAEAGPERLRVRLAGAFTDESGVSRDRFDTLLAAADVDYVGHTDDIGSLLDTADCVVLPSTYAEGVPRILLEAAAAGSLLMAYPNPGSAEIVRDGVNGWLVAEPTPAALTGALRSLLALDAPRYAAMRAAARASVDPHFDETRVLSAYLGLVEGTADPSPTAPRFSASP